jgi:hypothetical protein
MEFIWRPFEKHSGKENSIFTHVLYDFYYPPATFCWACDDEPIVDNVKSEEYNLEERL